jgi:hypothetical protein
MEHKHIEKRPSTLNSVRWGRIAIAAAGVELVTGAVSILTSDPMPAEIGMYLNACLVGGSLYNAHNHVKNDYPVPSDLAAVFVKQHETRQAPDSF